MYANRNREEVLKQFDTDRQTGLSSEQADERRQKYGFNKLEEQKKKGVFVLFFEQLQDPLIYILMAAIAISLFLGEAGDAMIIASVILLNSVVGVVQEDKARKAIDALKQLASPKALVRRDGKEIELPSEQIVPGDIVLLEAGRQVPADMRLLQAVNLKIEESALTGESVPVDKTDAKQETEAHSVG
ncbi:MAG: HAD-IC family P-type ATPase, partial [Lachnospiraceae bacterium]|nr:HAD-IC family P-type ATPase [Lachnospiraceae bacterium]